MSHNDNDTANDLAPQSSFRESGFASPADGKCFRNSLTSLDLPDHPDANLALPRVVHLHTGVVPEAFDYRQVAGRSRGDRGTM